ncbi:hypothetical protein GW932_04800 [archaeon]|nr:hypothetical protein [archaeon]
MNPKKTLKYIVEKNSNVISSSTESELPQRLIDREIYKMSKHWTGEPEEYFYRLMELFDKKELYDNEGILRYVPLSENAKQPRYLEIIFKNFVEGEMITPLKK